MDKFDGECYLPPPVKPAAKIDVKLLVVNHKEIWTYFAEIGQHSHL